MFDIDQCYDAFRPEKDRAYFWSGLGPNGQDIAAEIANENKGTTLEMLMEAHKDDLLKAGFEYDPSINRFVFSPENIDDWRAVSNAFAEQASGEVHVVLGNDVRDSSVWNTKEFPTLTENDAVSKVASVDPVTKQEKDVLLDKSAGHLQSEPANTKNSVSSNTVASEGGGARAPNSADTPNQNCGPKRSEINPSSPADGQAYKYGGCGPKRDEITPPDPASGLKGEHHGCGPQSLVQISPDKNPLDAKANAKEPAESLASNAAKNAANPMTGGIT